MLENTPTGGCWTPAEAENHMNYLKTQAVFLPYNHLKTKYQGKLSKLTTQQHLHGAR